MEKQSANPEGLAQAFDSGGADERSRTLDLLITNELLYQLSYIGSGMKKACCTGAILAKPIIIHILITAAGRVRLSVSLSGGGRGAIYFGSDPAARL